MTASTLTYPLDLIRTKLSILVADSTIKPSIWGTGKQIVREGGVLSLYKGLPSTLFVSKNKHLFIVLTGWSFTSIGNHSLHWVKNGIV